MSAWLAAALLTAALAGAQSPAASRAPAHGEIQALLRGVLDERDPQAAEEVLRQDQQGVQAGVGDVEKYRLLFRRAAELKDLKSLLSTMPETGTLRTGLLARKQCLFCQRPAELKAWMRRHLPQLMEPGLLFLDRALLEWDSLTNDRRGGLTSLGLSESAWQPLELTERLRLLQSWAAARHAAFMASQPKDLDDVSRLSRELDSFSEFLNDEQRLSALNHVTNARQALAEAMRQAAMDPLRQGSDAAELAPDIETSRERLDTVFDGLGGERRPLNAGATPPPAHKFDDRSRQLLTGLLGTSLLREVHGTWAGDDAEDFYRKNALHLRIAPLASHKLAEYGSGRISFNETAIEEYLKSSGRGVAELTRDGRALKELSMLLSPVFVHEATHQMQDHWAVAQNIPWKVSRHLELETMQVHALFTLEKSRRDPAFARFMRDNKRSGAMASSSIKLAEQLRTDGPEHFRAWVESLYDDTMPLEGAIWTETAHVERLRDALRRELERRPNANPSPLFLPHILMPDLTLEQLIEKLPTLHPQQLETMLRQQETLLAEQPRIFERYRDRLAEANRLTEIRLSALETERGDSRRRRREPPAPLTSR